MGLKIIRICLKIDVLQLFREIKGPLRIVLCKDSLQFDQCFRLVFSHFATIKFHKVKFTNISSAVKTARKPKRILHSFGF